MINSSRQIIAASLSLLGSNNLFLLDYTLNEKSVSIPNVRRHQIDSDIYYTIILSYKHNLKIWTVG